MAGLLAGGAQAGPAIVPCDPEASPLVQAMSGGIDDGEILVSSMPKGGEQVPADVLQVVTDWIATGAGLDACEQADEADGPSPVVDEDVTFIDDIYPLFEAYICTTCHANAGSGGLDVSTVDALLAGGTKAGPAVIPCDPDASPLVRVLEGGWSEGAQTVGVMPPFGELMTSDDVSRVRAWIAKGAGVEACQ